MADSAGGRTSAPGPHDSIRSGDGKEDDERRRFGNGSCLKMCIRDRINSVYLSTLIKMIGITYVAEFAAGICKDAGYGAVGTQIEIFGKLSVLAVSMPILLALIETLQVFLS